MKNRIVFLYIGIFVAVIVVFFITTSIDNSSKEVPGNPPAAEQNMPDDDVHNKLKNENPGIDKNIGSVNKSYYNMLDSVKKEFESSPNDTAKIYAYANFLNISHRMDDAILLYNKILKVDPKRNDVYFALTVSYIIKEDYAKAEEMNNKVLGYDKNNAQAKYNLGFIAMKKGDNALAKERWEKLVKENPGTRQAKDAQERLNGK